MFGGEIKKSFSKKEVKEAIGILEEASKKFGSRGFDLVKEHVEKSILSDTQQFIDVVRKGRSVRKYVYSMIANVSGDMVESGHYHIYRGVLSNYLKTDNRQRRRYQNNKQASLINAR